MYLGYNTNGFAHHRLEQAIDIIADLGYEGVALTLDYHALNPFDADISQSLARVKQRCQQRGLRSVIETGARFLLDPRRKHQPTLISSEPTEQAVRLDFLLRAIEIAAELQSDAVSFWSGSTLTSEPDSQFRERLIANLSKLLPRAESLGVTLALEAEPGMFIETTADAQAIIDHVANPKLRLVLDIGHPVCLGEEKLPTLIRKHASSLAVVHLDDMRPGKHDHLPFGEGVIDLREVLATLTEVGFKGGGFVELSRHSHDAVRVAEQALQFLREASIR